MLGGINMNKIALLYLASILAGFALTITEPVSFINAGIINFFHIIGVLAMIVFSLAILIMGVRALFRNTV